MRNLSLYAPATLPGVGRVELELEVAVCGRYVRGRYDGPPETCYPDEWPEVELVAAWYLADDGRRVAVSLDELPTDWPELDQAALAALELEGAP